jgi:hypothetical protein
MSGTESALADSPGHLDSGDDLLPAALGAHPSDRLGLKRMEVVPVHGRETVGAGRELGADWRRQLESGHERTEGGADSMEFDIIGPIWEIETIAVGSRIRDLSRLRRAYGRGRWRKRKGVAIVRLHSTGEIFRAEVHWYEAAGVGRKDLKIKRRIE